MNFTGMMKPKMEDVLNARYVRISSGRNAVTKIPTSIVMNG